MKNRFFAWFACALFTPGLVPLLAQDVIVGEPSWASSEPAPDELPKSKGRLRPEFPEEMRKASQIGYVMVSQYIDASGKSLALNAQGTHEPYQRVVQEAFHDWSMTAARQNGQGVDGRIWLGVIFNPKSAAVKGPEAMARLLTVVPVFTSERPTPANLPPIVPTKFALDDTGAITGVSFENKLPGKLAEEIEVAVKSWRFAPARKEGKPVASDVTVPVLCQMQPKAHAPKRVPPRALQRLDPEYPVAMRRFGLGGQVVMDFVVDTDGKVTDPVVFESDNPSFDAPALKALLKWKFQPGTRDGTPVKTKMRVPITFTLDWGPVGKGVTEISRSTDQSKLPPELRYDTPAKFRGVMMPVYPLELRMAGISGKASVALVIEPNGRVGQVKVLTADRPEFGLALVAAAEGFRFDPAFKDGKPVRHVLRFDQEFNSSSLDDEEGERLMRLEKKSPERIVPASKLDRIPVPISRRSPLFPVQLIPLVSEGDAFIEFLIDEAGHARLPRVISAKDPAFGYAAMQAVGTWLFTPPLSGGKPVVTRAKIPLTFSLNAAPPSNASVGGGEATSAGAAAP